jgi:hypothetical protein
MTKDRKSDNLGLEIPRPGEGSVAVRGPALQIFHGDIMCDLVVRVQKSKTDGRQLDLNRGNIVRCHFRLDVELEGDISCVRLS